MNIPPEDVRSSIDFTYDGDEYNEAVGTHSVSLGSMDVTLTRIAQPTTDRTAVRIDEAGKCDEVTVWTNTHCVEWGEFCSLPGLICSLQYTEPPASQLASLIQMVDAPCTEESA
jgi:hypothetical protein